MSQTYQLSKSGIERLERFKRDVIAGDFEITKDCFDDGSVLCFIVGNSDSATCCFVQNESEVINDFIRNYEKSFCSEIVKSKFGYILIDGLPLTRNDITTPAQRALEELANKLNGDNNA